MTTLFTIEQAQQVIAVQARAVDALAAVGAFDDSSPAKSGADIIEATNQRMILVQLDPDLDDTERAIYPIRVMTELGTSIEHGIKGILVAAVTNPEGVIENTRRATPTGEPLSTEEFINRVDEARSALDEAFELAMSIHQTNTV